MPEKPIKIPGPDHPITITAYGGRIVIRLNGQTIADSRNILTLREASYPAVHYIPRADVDMAALARSDHTTYCPYKGDASYFGVPTGGAQLANAIWSYEAPYSAVVEIRDHLAFYPDRFEIVEHSA
ncbi:MAG TPA: DUF427 domain-containing protein [Pararhizobium sp.]|uniref:DUF427 domain-containing protein n=1 Tax=Pararhizobium sp. TaxID=1977563 RepID=UPI002BF938F9|nr:DUF427 domain-containing protein [Pararhizobium sp.]HTO32027.1 DUF427 domain-containing protein [Pararhizobium sp.]